MKLEIDVTRIRDRIVLTLSNFDGWLNHYNFLTKLETKNFLCFLPGLVTDE